MNKYKNLHRWMIIPMVIMQLGILQDYWGDVLDNAWAVHIHYWTGTIWYFYLVIQPYYATHGKMEKHRTNGIIGMFLAGAVCSTALGIMHRDIATAERSITMPERFGPFQAWFFYGVIVVEIVMMTAFAFVIIKGILHRRQLENHAWWLISSVFIIMMPALGRGVQNVHIMINISAWPNIDIMIPIYITQVLIMTMLLAAAWKYDKLRHPATLVALAVNVFIFLLEPIGRSLEVQAFLKSVVKG